MKRALIVLPLLALLLGLVLFLLHRSQAGLPLFRPATGGSETPHSHEAEAKPSPTAATAAPVDGATGGIKFIVTCDGRPVKDAKITVQKQGTPELMTFQTEADGTRVLLGLPAVEFGVYVDHPDLLQSSGEVKVVAGQTQDLQIELYPGARIYGTVTDRAGNPIPDTRVFCLSADERPRPMPGTAVNTDQKGCYEIKRIPQTSVGLRFRHKKFKPLDRPAMTFSRPTDEYKIDVVLELGATITGRVVDEQGRPIEGAHVMASNIESAMTERTAKDGTFSLGGLFHKPANCQASMKGYGTVVMRNLPPDGPPVEFRLPKAGALLGKVVADVALPEFQIVLSRYDDGLKQIIQTDSRQFQKSPGNIFNLEDLCPGTYWVDIQVEDFEAVDRPQVIIVGGQIVEGVVITLRKKN
jgi:hypothetical protein